MREMVTSAQWRPVVYITVRDGGCRSTIVDALHRQGWAVVEKPSGFHLIQAIAGVIEGDQPWLRPGLIVVDAVSPGCAGITIAAGLRDLGVRIPIVVVTQPGDPVPATGDDTIRVVESADAAAAVAELARPWSPARVLDAGAAPQRAIA